jgi:acyl-CoA dehydrogenase
MDFTTPPEIAALLEEIDAFVDGQIAPLEAANPEFFDQRREFARTNPEDGTPAARWTALLEQQRRLADAAGLYRFTLPSELGGRDGSNLATAFAREHLAARGPGLHNDLHSHESSAIGNLPMVHIVHALGSPAQRARLEEMITGELCVAFAFTEPDHGSDATWMKTTAVRDGDGWVINGAKRFVSDLPRAQGALVFARTSGSDGDAGGITAFWVPTDAPGHEIAYFHWTLNMPTDHAEVVLRDVRVGDDAVVGEVGDGLKLARFFVLDSRIRQAASSVGAAQFCIDRAVAYARERVSFGRPLSERQAIQWPLVELQTEAELVRNLVRKAAWMVDREDRFAVSELVSMANYRANRLACEAADRAMQVHGGLGYTRALPFEHVYRHHRRYRITEGSEEIQIRNVAGHMFGYIAR